MIQIANRLWKRYARGSMDRPDCQRFMLWIDRVGGYRVCLGNEIMIGQPSDDGSVDVPILGDLSRHHARLRRDGEGYMIEALRDVTVDGRPVRQFAWLRDGSRLQLGESVRLLFRRPHSLSATIRLEFASRHRMQPSADAVLWMADSCVLGPRSNSHVMCRSWTREVVLVHNQWLLDCRTQGVFTVDGAPCIDCGSITRHSRVQGEGFSFKLESLD